MRKLWLTLPILTILVPMLFLRVMRVQGISMSPTLQHDDLLLVWMNDWVPPRQGDMVVLQIEGTYHFKRVIGLPGDTLSVDDKGNVTLNGQLLDEPYCQKGADHHTVSGSWLVPPGEIFVMGDNRKMSTDSRVWGPISDDFLAGYVIKHLPTSKN